MTVHANSFALFSDTDGNSIVRSMRLLRKRGEPFLLIPTNPKMAAQAFSLFPAQTVIAKFAKTSWEFAAGICLPVGSDFKLVIQTKSSFANFLQSIARTKEIPQIAILAGNARTPGRRFIILVFDDAGCPVLVVKAGNDPAARALVDREIGFLKNVSPEARGIPRLRKEFVSPSIHAFSLDFVQGNSPDCDDDKNLFTLLNSWIDKSRKLSLAQTSHWETLKNATSSEIFQKIENKLGDLKFHPTISHGDLAPWNIKTHADSWTALDWERGELTGIPGWDYFHFQIQPAILVKRLSPTKVLERMEKKIQSRAFLDYSERARIREYTTELLLAYLLYQIAVIRPTEGKLELEQIFSTLSKKVLSV